MGGMLPTFFSQKRCEAILYVRALNSRSLFKGGVLEGLHFVGLNLDLCAASSHQEKAGYKLFHPEINKINKMECAISKLREQGQGAASFFVDHPWYQPMKLP